MLFSLFQNVLCSVSLTNSINLPAVRQIYAYGRMEEHLRDSVEAHWLKICIGQGFGKTYEVLEAEDKQ